MKEFINKNVNFLQNIDSFVFPYLAEVRAIGIIFNDGNKSTVMEFE